MRTYIFRMRVSKGADKKKQENGGLLPWVQPRIYYLRARAYIAYVLTEARNTYTQLDDLVAVVCIRHTRLHAYFGNYLAVYVPPPPKKTLRNRPKLGHRRPGCLSACLLKCVPIMH